MTPLDLALRYIERGWNPIPVPFRSKRPEGDAWQARVIDAAAAPQYFDGGPSNIGVLLGPSSHGLTDVDLDCAEAIAIAPYILPRTRAIFGRASKRASHWLYYTDLAVTAGKAVQKFVDPRTKQMLVELRIGGDKGAQTIFPGSTHEDGEPITWEENGEPASADDLDEHVRTLAAFTLLARGWPQGRSTRHGLALVVGGFLARNGASPAKAKLAVEAIAKAAYDEEWRDRAKAAEDAVSACRKGDNSYGFPALAGAFGKEVAMKVAEWLGYSSGNGAQAPQAEPDTGVGVSLEDFWAYMPQHGYIFVPSRDLWPASSVNARVPPVIGPDGKPIAPSKWLASNRAVEQMGARRAATHQGQADLRGRLDQAARLHGVQSVSAPRHRAARGRRQPVARSREQGVPERGGSYRAMACASRAAPAREDQPRACARWRARHRQGHYLGADQTSRRPLEFRRRVAEAGARPLSTDFCGRSSCA
jgi:hypothetical protein